ncbi:helix-turn-helix transcriptional regulator [Nakamurella alba]|nr:AAA family ATPase [Nakamurella alba]
MGHDAVVARTSSSRMIGRKAELAELRALLTAAADGTAGAAIVGGDAGVGKTRLLEVVTGQARELGFTVLTGNCVQVGDFGLPYLPVIDALRDVESTPEGHALLAEQVARRPALGRLLPHLVDAADREPGGSTTGPDRDGDALVQGQLFEAVHRILTDLAATTPVLLVIEDLHWADRSTRDLLSFLARTLRTGRIAVIASYRSDDLHRRHPLRPLLAELARLPQINRITVPALGRAELAELLEQISGRPADPASVDALHQRSEGNPFYAEELIGCAPRKGPDRMPVGDLPTDLADLLLDRVAALPEDGQEVLRVAAVAGRRVDEGLLAAVAGQAVTDAGLRQAVESGLLVPSGPGESYSFRHALLQEAVYGDLLPGERARRHARFAEVLAARAAGAGNAAELAHHQLAAHDREGALQTLIRAADEAEKLAAPAEALQHLEQALDLLDQLGTGADRVDLLSRAAHDAYATGDARRAVVLQRAAITEVDATGTVEQRASARERISHYLLEAEEGDVSGPAAEAVALMADLPEQPLTAQTLATWARTLLWRDVAKAGDLLGQAIAVADRIGAPHLAADASISRALLARRGIGGGDGAEMMESALARIGTGTGADAIRIRALRFISHMRLENGELDAALAAADAGVELANDVGLTWTPYGQDLQMMRGWVLMAAGRWDEVLERGLGAVWSPNAAGRILASQAVWVLAQRGDPAVEQLIVRLRATGDWFLGLQIDLSEMQLRVQQLRPEDALAIADRVRPEAGAEGGFGTEYLLMIGSELAARAQLADRARAAGDDEAVAGHLAAAELYLGQAERITRAPSLAGPYGDLLLARVRAEAARLAGTDTAADWAEMARTAVVSGRVPERGYATARQFAAQLTAGDRGPDTVELGRQALADATALRIPWLVDQVTGLADRARLRLRPAGDRRTDRTQPGSPGQATATTKVGSNAESDTRSQDVLTPRELEVLALVAAGLSNGAIGKKLFISAKTASVHVSHILAKLGATSRTEAAALARARGLLLETSSGDHPA